MISASDILKILDQIPIWKTLRTLPTRVADLEARLAALEDGPDAAAHLQRCEICGKPAKVTAIRDHPQFGFAGRKIKTITCADGHNLDFDWKPGET